MDEYYSTIEILPDTLRIELRALRPAVAPRIQEVRLRAGLPVQFTIAGRLQPACRFLPDAKHAACLTKEMLRSCFLSLCRHSVYAHEEELRQGFFTLPNGGRIGVAGTRSPGGFATVTSLNLRISRHLTCALPPPLLEILDTLGAGILVAGVPGSGKTTFLRSMIQYLERSDRILCIADERSELAPALQGTGCDCYTRCSKADGISMALRCMNPQVIVCDELGTAADIAAVEAGLASGVVFLASVHCDNPDHLRRKPQLVRLLGTGAFETVVFLSGREHPGEVARLETLP